MVKSKVIIGGKRFTAYIPAVMIAFEKSDTVELSAAGGNVRTLDRIVENFTTLSCGHITEKSRKPHKYKPGMDAMVCILVKGK
jgi:hypothetical protein